MNDDGDSIDPFDAAINEFQRKQERQIEEEFHVQELVASSSAQQMSTGADLKGISAMARLLRDYFEKQGDGDKYRHLQALDMETSLRQRRLRVPFADNPNDRSRFPAGFPTLADVKPVQHNLVCTAHLQRGATPGSPQVGLTETQIQRIVHTLFMEHNPSSYSATMRDGFECGGPKCTLMIFFYSSHILLTGSNHYFHEAFFLMRFLRALRRVMDEEICLSPTGMISHNSVFGFEYPYGIDFKRMAREGKEACAGGESFVLRASDFDGVYLRLPQNQSPEIGNVVILAYPNGTCILTGAKGANQAMQAINNALPVLWMFRTSKPVVTQRKPASKKRKK